MDGKQDVIMTLVYCGLAVFLCFVVGGFGVVSAVYAVLRAFRAREKGHQFAGLCIGLSIATAIAIGGMLIFRMQRGAY
jgi:hypothetical protein